MNVLDLVVKLTILRKEIKMGKRPLPLRLDSAIYSMELPPGLIVARFGVSYRKVHVGFSTLIMCVGDIYRIYCIVVDCWRSASK